MPCYSPLSSAVVESKFMSASLALILVVLELWLNTDSFRLHICELRPTILNSKSILFGFLGDLLKFVEGVAGFSIGYGMRLLGVGSTELKLEFFCLWLSFICFKTSFSLRYTNLSISWSFLMQDSMCTLESSGLSLGSALSKELSFYRKLYRVVI